MSQEIAVDRARLDHTRPADQARGPIAALPVGRLLAAVRSDSAVRPGHHLSAVVSAVDDDRVIDDPQVIELLQQMTDGLVVLDHAVGVGANAGLSRDSA